MRCLVCGKVIPKGKTIDDCIMVSGITEHGEWWQGYAFICELKCFLKLKQRMFKDKKGTVTIFPQN